MIIINSQLAALKELKRNFQGKVELLSGSTVLETYNYTDNLISFNINRLGEEGKFFGFGITQQATIELLDKDRTINIIKGAVLRPRITAVASSTSTLVPFPLFYVSEVQRDENTNKLTITAEDIVMKNGSKYTFAELGLIAPYTIQDVAMAAATKLGLTFAIREQLSGFDAEYPEGANFEGTETLRDVLKAVAEATQTIYFVDRNANLMFIRLSDTKTPDLTIRKADYFTLTGGTNRTLTAIASVTELGNNVIAGTEDGSTQYVRENPFWDLRDDIDVLLNEALDNVGGLTISQFNCSWRGNFLLEPGDKIALVAKDDSVITSYIINDSISYNGGLSQTTQWTYAQGDTESTNPATLGDTLKQTYAKVDKVNRQIDLVVQDTQELEHTLSTLQIATDGISATVQSIENQNDAEFDAINGTIQTLTKQVQMNMTKEQVSIIVQSELGNGIGSVKTSNGFYFNDSGLNISKSNSEISTQITEDGMTVYKNSEAVLVANNEGVRAQDLHATTFLIIGTNSRLEDFDGGTRTGCFWIGQ